MKEKNYLILAVLAALLIGFVGFYAGQQYQMNKSKSAFQAGGWTNNGNRNLGGGMMDKSQGSRMGGGMRPVAGEIIESDGKSVTVKLVDGSSKIVILSNSTAINKAETASKSDLKTGEKISVFGTTNSDGSMTATNIQIGAMVRGLNSPTTTPAK